MAFREEETTFAWAANAPTPAHQVESEALLKTCKSLLNWNALSERTTVVRVGMSIHDHGGLAVTFKNNVAGIHKSRGMLTDSSQIR